MNNKKICFIVALSTVGGADKILLAHNSVLIKNGFESVLYSIRPIDRHVLYDEYLKKGVIIKDYSKYTKYLLKIIKYILIPPGYVALKVYYQFNGLNTADLKNKLDSLLGIIIQKICEPILFFRILIDTLRFKYDIISAFHYSTLRLVYFLKKFLKITTIYTEISSPKYRSGHINRRELDKHREYLNSFDKIVVPSKIIGNELVQYEGLNKEYIVSPFFVELPNYDVQIINKKAESFGVIARLSREKKQDVLIKVLKTIIDQGKNMRLILVGTGPEENYYKKLASELGVSNKVSFIPFFNDISRVMDKIDIFVLCSDVEGMSLSLIEALYFGKPVLARDVGTNSELVINGFNGFLVDSNNIKDIAEKIILVMDNMVLFKKFSENSRRLFEEKFNTNIESLSKQLLEIYNNE